MAKQTTDRPAQSAAEKKAARQLAKVQKFKEVGTKRVTKAMSAIALIAPLANRNSYTYDQAQVNAIFNALNGAMKAVADAFATPAAGSDSGFKL